MAKASEPIALLAVKEAFTFDGDVFLKGDPIEPDHPFVKKWPHFFEPLKLKHPAKRTAVPVVEQATAAPGEKRGG